MIYSWQNRQWQQFSKLKEQARLPHAIIITGAEGLGKLSFANHIAASVLCNESTSAEPCGHCHGCQLFRSESHPDHTFIAPEETGKQIKIEQIRQLKEKQALTTTVGTWKTVIITPADSMNISANNSLLKLLEEPQDNTLLLLLSAKPESLPITILSRCQKVSFTVPSFDVAFDFVKQAKPELNEPELKRALSLAKGAPLQALALLDSDIIQQSQDVEAEFKSIIEGRANPVELAKKWQNYDLVLCLNHLQLLIQKRVVVEQEKSNAEQVAHYWYIYDCITQAIKLTSLSNNINKILLIEQFMVSVMNPNWQHQIAVN